MLEHFNVSSFFAGCLITGISACLLYYWHVIQPAMILCGQNYIKPMYDKLMPILVPVMKSLIEYSKIVGTCIANFIFRPYSVFQNVLRKQVVLHIRKSEIFKMCIMSPACEAVLKYCKVFFVCTNFYVVKSALISDTIFFLFFYCDLADKSGQIVIAGDIVLYSFFLIFVLPDWYVEFHKALPKYLKTDGQEAFDINLGANALAQLCLLCVLNIIKLNTISSGLL